VVGDGRLPLVDNRLVVGRGEQADVRLADDSVSRRHALLWREGGVVWISDLGSANGTRAGGRPVVEPTTLTEGDEVAFGVVTARMTTR
jgi:pSer/pThr/pTyr-binding forkhead associated (FHA) protein